ncbi:MAG: hypothetical protein IRZ05_00345 [Micromonosporaceae bacterium]|nr:hypothetical protein [Micromonosporaceae bacterium]
MGSTVEIYARYPGSAHSLAHRVAEALEVTGYAYSGEDFVFAVDARGWLGEEGFGHLTLDRVDPEWAADTPYAGYDFELSLDYRGELERLGRALFDRLTALDLPLAYGDYLAVFAEHQPAHPAPPPPTGLPAAGRAVVFETDDQLQAVPVTGDPPRWRTPVARTRSAVGAAAVGAVLAAVLAAAGGVDDPERMRIALTEPFPIPLSVAEFARRSVAVMLQVAGGELVAVPYVCEPDSLFGQAEPGTPMEELARRGPADVTPQGLGALVLHLVDQARASIAGQ